jgi:hypothetical protein
MARAQLSQQKRARERAKLEQRQQKAERRETAKTEWPARHASANAADPDIAGIVPGPQPSPWDDD